MALDAPAPAPAPARSLPRPSRRRKPASAYPPALHLDSVLFDLWPSLTDALAHAPADPAVGADPHVPLAFSHPAKLLGTLPTAPHDALVHAHLPHVYRRKSPSPLHSPLSSPGLEPSASPSSRYHPDSDTVHPSPPQPNVEEEDPSYFNMVKNRRSLQSILIPPFLQSSSSSDTAPSPTRLRSHSAAATTTTFSLPPAIPLSIPPVPTPVSPVSPPRGSPPSDLLDDDPFADLSAGPSVIRTPSSLSRASPLFRSRSRLDTPPSVPPTPRSPLSQHSFSESDDTPFEPSDASSSSDALASTPATPPPTPVIRSKSVGSPKRPWSSGHGQARPAYTRPAIKPRPSLPSLHALAQAQVVIPKVRRGRVGAQLPYEPWQSLSLDGESSRDGESSEGADVGVPCLPEPQPQSVSASTSSMDTHRRKPSHSRRPSGLTTIRDSRILTGALVTSPTELEPGEYFTEDDVRAYAAFEEVEDEPVAEAEAEAAALVEALADRASDDQVVSRSGGPALIRAHSEPSPVLEPLCELSPDPHTRASFPSSVDLLPYDFPSPPRDFSFSSSLRGRGYGTAFPSDTKFLDLLSTLDDEILQLQDGLSSLDLMSSHAALEAIGYSSAVSNTLSGETKSTTTTTDEAEFEPGTSAETIRTLNHSHRRNPSNFSQHSQTLEWSYEAEELTRGLPISPSSTTSSRSSSGHSSSSSNDQDLHLAYDLEGSSGDHFHFDRDFVTFHSDSSEESLSPTLMSLSMSTSDSATSTSAAHTPSSSSVPTPYNSFYEDQDAPFELDEDVIHLSVPMPPIPKTLSRTSSCSSSEPSESQYVTANEEPMDGGDSNGNGGRRGDCGPSYGHSSYSRNVTGGSSTSSRGGGGFSHGSSGGHGGGCDDDDRWNRRPPVRTALPVSRDSETSDSEDDYGHDEDHVTQVSSRSPAKSRPIPRRTKQESETDDDVPLAQQIPTALKAQKTIRRQVKDEIDMRRRKKSESKPASPSSPMKMSIALGQSPPVPSMMPRLRGSFNNDPVALANTREVLQAAAPISAPVPAGKPMTRPRTKTLPSNSTNPFSAGDLKAKLLGIQFGRHSRNPSDDPSARAPPMPARISPIPLEPQPRTSTEATRTLRPSRSFHRPRTADSERPPPPPVPLPLDPSVKLGRSATSVSRRHPRQDPQYAPPPPPSAFEIPESRVSLDRSRTTRTSSSRRPSLDTREDEASPRRPPMPPLPSTEVVANFAPPPPPPPAPVVKETWNQRIFICGLQRFCQVEVDASTTAGDVLKIMDSQNQLRGAPNLGPAAGWMLFEICHDFGMERPIRSFELLSSVSGSWVADKTTNAFMAKNTLMAPVLSRTAVPTSSPMFSGYVQHEYKRGKWQKRWMELREHSLWLSKKENGKDQICLCSLHNFDAYVVTRVNKAPKGYIFAVKSTDNLSFFEDTSDYMHQLCCSEKDGAKWMEKILLARSYVLYQERNVLTNASAPSASAGNTGGAALSRAGTRKRPAQPLVNIGHVPTAEAPIAPAVFEPGSLLAKRVL